MLGRHQRTKIVCTIGPATSSPEMLRAIVEAGADILRVNLSHGSRDEHERTVATARAVGTALRRNLGVLLDLRGAKIRLTTCSAGPFELPGGAEVLLEGGNGPTTAERLRVAPAVALVHLSAGKRILIDDGKLALRVVAAEGTAWRCRVEAGGVVRDRKGVALIEVPTDQLPGLTEKDVDDIRWGVRLGADLFALSFVRAAADVRAAKRHILEAGGDAPIVAKLEKPEAMSHLDEILEESYGVMVARGDLGVEAPLESVPVLQKRIIAAARRHRKPVITATQMLESMIDHPVPTRAEVSDVANAVFDGTDAVMLSAETSVGKYPVEAVLAMGRTIAEAESVVVHAPRTYAAGPSAFADAMGVAACVAAESVGAKCIAVYAAGDHSATVIAGHRPAVPIHAFSDSEAVVRRLGILWGVEARRPIRAPASVEELVHVIESALVEDRIAAPGDTIVLVTGVPFREQESTNVLKLHRIGESARRPA